ncbi:MAG TPA: nitroreductase family protein [bacterium]|nr:nitroreductase family protein [bacterium]
MINGILTRRSIRKYTNEPVSREHQEQIARAGFAAPSARNAQPWHIVMVDDRVAEIRDILGIPESMQVLSLIAAGHPAETKPPRDDMKRERLHYNKW